MPQIGRFMCHFVSFDAKSRAQYLCKQTEAAGGVLHLCVCVCRRDGGEMRHALNKKQMGTITKREQGSLARPKSSRHHSHE